MLFGLGRVELRASPMIADVHPHGELRSVTVAHRSRISHTPRLAGSLAAYFTPEYAPQAFGLALHICGPRARRIASTAGWSRLETSKIAT